MSSKECAKVGSNHNYQDPIRDLSCAQKNFQTGNLFRKKLEMDVFTLPVSVTKQNAHTDEELGDWEEERLTFLAHDLFIKVRVFSAHAALFCKDAVKLLYDSMTKQMQLRHWRMLFRCSDPDLAKPFWILVELQLALPPDGGHRIAYHWNLTRNDWADEAVKQCVQLGKIKTTPCNILELAKKNLLNGQEYRLAGRNCQDWVVGFLVSINYSLRTEEKVRGANGKLVRPEGMQTVREVYKSPYFLSFLDSLLVRSRQFRKVKRC